MIACSPSMRRSGDWTTCWPNRARELRKSCHPNQSVLREQHDKVRDEADVLILAGDLTNYGKPEEMEPLLNAMVRVRIPTIAVLGNHDFESDCQQELMTLMTNAGIKVLDGNGYERDGVGFAGTKGFVG